ncbi:carbohydrate ABC transporter permease [Oceanispirochaeta sp.]|jgi:multiple sugar transport system permease protein|uniref:carbohydrate ABC transporter permease n=1 Tax=Oceanispirochaeta sp. TaxID=2035350 RepID=UPI00262A1546|nr:sugar ABC transporter permease [Oceanispirochaeta sp.]MDA3957102.1 sugar ABC transporter permease [Oceanispirochaeta sp.]
MFDKYVTRFLLKQQVAAYVLILPSLAIISIFYLIPLFASFAMSFMKMDIFLQNITFTGAANYQKILGDERFWNALKNTLYFTVLEIPLQIGLSLFLALYVSKVSPFRQGIRTALFIPVICSMTAMGILWSLLLDPSIGFFPHLLKMAGMESVNFLKNKASAMPAVVIMSVWKNFGLSMVILVAAIQSVPLQLYEAAKIDGAGLWQRLFSITVPSILPALGFCIITNTIDCLKVFDQVYVMTQGGPLFRTETIVQYIYNRGFRIAPFNLGYSSAIAQILLVLIAAMTLLIYTRFIKQEKN